MSGCNARYVEVNGHRPDWRHMTVMLNVLSQSLDNLSCHCLSALLQVTLCLSVLLLEWQCFDAVCWTTVSRM